MGPLFFFPFWKWGWRKAELGSIRPFASPILAFFPPILEIGPFLPFASTISIMSKPDFWQAKI
jgi:hypothetical protein